MLPSCRLSLSGGRPHRLHLLVDGGDAPQPALLRALARATRRVSVMQLPDGHDGLDWLAPIASRIEELTVHDLGCTDLGALERFTHLRMLVLRAGPHPTTPALTRVASTVREYAGPWFPALDPVLASPELRILMLEQPPRDIGNRLTAPLEQVSLLSARKLTTVPVLSCIGTLRTLAIAGGGAMDLTGIAAYKQLTSLDLYGRTPLTSFAELARCPKLRRLFLEECYAVDDIQALRHLTLDELRIVGRPESMNPDFLATARSLGVRRFSAPPSPVAGGRTRRRLLGRGRSADL